MDILLCDQSSETRLEQVVQILQNVAKSVKEGIAPLSSFVITKQLSKNPDAYPDKKQLSHVIVALRLNKAGGRMWKAGDTLPYVICEVFFHFTILIREFFEWIKEAKRYGIILILGWNRCERDGTSVSH